MANVKYDISDDELRKALRENDWIYSRAADAIGLEHSTLRNIVYKRPKIRAEAEANKGRKPEAKPKEAGVELPTFPDPNLPIEDVLDTLQRQFKKRHEHREARKWYKIRVKDRGPIGLSFFGDPHIDDSGCNIPLLRHHCKLHADTDGLYGVNVGDTTNNWAGRLARLYANQETSAETARRLAKWFLKDSGIDWLAWIMGNHELWNDQPALLREMNTTGVPMDDWQAQFKLVFPNKRECRIWVSHNFEGHSMWNTLHGPQKAAHKKAEADIYACGHTHNWATHQEESASRDFTYWLIRARGYKYLDDYAEKLGHFPQKEGASITCIIDPESESMAGFVQAFADMDAAVDYLNWKRQRKAA